MRDKLTPRYAVGCKRPGFHNTYLSTFNRDNVSLVTEPIEKITGSGVATADGESHDAEVLILATGFKVLDPDGVLTYSVTGPRGRTLSQFWEDHRLQAYEGVSIPGFPNFFTVFGPYGYVGSSYFALIETQSHHIVRCLQHARRRGATRVEVTQEANDRYFAEMMRKRHRQIFWQDSCSLANSYYFDKQRRRTAATRHHDGGVLAQPPLPARRLRVQRLAPRRRPSARRPCSAAPMAGRRPCGRSGRRPPSAHRSGAAGPGRARSRPAAGRTRT